ncbi:LOW QUALITY PROTEIN: LIM homeobox transcription factor 1-beta [Drosophila busckii]|uniref:LOW QUALITY PROTEIN: LIM homeobox transcription factor 1-beta n=1 Tax=Drosophila busckii TaxID=30019 RepID=UPI001432DB35|nr:LOW QUALITY PROTEIN: LIM homeobox transcription factor 1-beta [Drosophila busckii]
MLEFYPMPTNLNQVGGSLYSLQQNHGGARFLDSPSATSVDVNNTIKNVCFPSTNSISSNNNNNNNSSTPSNNHNLPANISGSTNNSPISTASLTASVIPSKQQQHPSHAVSPAQINSCPTPTGLSPNNNNNNHNNNNNNNNIINNRSASPLTLASTSKLSADCSGRTEVGHIKCEKNYELCEGCGQKIHDRYLMNVGDSNWHEQCLACCYCGMQLNHTCYVRNSKLYCKQDYDRLFGIKCAACCHSILPQELVMRPIPNYVFHLSCFVCFACRLPLQKGEQFMLRDGQLFCYRHDLEKEMFLAAAAGQHCGFVGLDEEDLLRPRDGRRGPKRPRTILTSQQRKQFKASFDQSPKPCRKVREALAKDTGLSVRVVQVWFQNQRAKMKKIQRKAKQNGVISGSGGNGRGTASATASDDKDASEKEDKCVKQEHGSDTVGFLGSMDSSFASRPLNPNLPFSPDDYPANSNDSFCSSDLSLDGSNFDQLDDDADSLSLNNLELQSTSSSGNHNQHSNPHDMLANLNTSLINPIDKLYLMQNSYFSSEH